VPRAAGAGRGGGEWMFNFVNGSVPVGERRGRQGILVELGAYEVLRDVSLRRRR
jgi:hypothetical protein